MFRVLIAVALIQHNLGKPLEDGLLIPHDVEMIPVEEHGHHIITTASLETISIEDHEISLNDDYEGEVDDDNNIPKHDGSEDMAPCSAEVEDKSPNCKDQSTETDLKQVKTESLETNVHENVETTEGKETDDGLQTNEDKETHESVETTEVIETDDGLQTNEDEKTNENVGTTEGKETDDGVKSNEGKETNEIVHTNGSVETNEIVLLNQTLRMNSSAIVDGKLTIVLNFKVLDDHTVEVVSSEIVDPADLSKDIKESDDDDEVIKESDDDDIVHFSGPVHAHGKVCVSAHYGCGDDDNVEADRSEIVHSADVLRDTNETVHDEHDDDEDEDDDTVYFSGPVHAHGKVCVSAHYGCGDSHTVEGVEMVQLGDNSKDSNETVDDEDDGDKDDVDEDDDDEDDENYHFCGPVHAQGNVCIGAHYGCGGPPISMCFSRPCGHGQHFSHTMSENDHHFQEEDKEDIFANCQYRCPNIACQHHPSVWPCGPCRIPENHFDHHQNHIDHHHDHRFDYGQDRHNDHLDRHLNHHYSQDHHVDHHRDHHFDHSQNHLFDHHQDYDFDDYQDKFDYSHEHKYEDFEKYFSRVLGYSDFDSGEEYDFPRWFPVSGYVPASGSVKIAARY